MATYLALKRTVAVLACVAIAGAAVVWVSGQLSGPGLCPSAGRAGQTEDEMATKLWLQIVDRKRSMCLRREAARELASTRAADGWIILLLTDPTAMYHPDEAEGLIHAPDVVRQSLDAFDAAVIDALLRGIRPDAASPAVLWAVSSRLSDNRIGMYSEKQGVWPILRIADCMTPPLRDSARQVLIRALGRDLGYDTGRWRRAILQSRRGQHGLPVQEPVPANPSTSPSSEPGQAGQQQR